ncbi:MAG: stage V sporulation protein AC [Oscillospiraceae bacterium]|jgi:stage V sporulation protein AC|nr:stage V sporulation protein AC [Oscillospiraceae bacterium]MCI8942925.1 stage V sporulation protein AC [Oscillospiraceae bacterium]
MEISKQEYQKFVQDRAKSSPIVKNCALAFVIGGGICVLGQAVMDGWTALGLEKTDAGTATSICLVFLSVLLTGMNLYNKLGRYGGAGTLVPITGFANAVASPAIDFKTEGMVTGMAAKMFTVAGPVIVFGVTASVAYGVILMVLQMLP